MRTPRIIASYFYIYLLPYTYLYCILYCVLYNCIVHCRLQIVSLGLLQLQLSLQYNNVHNNNTQLQFVCTLYFCTCTTTCNFLLSPGGPRRHASSGGVVCLIKIVPVQATNFLFSFVILLYILEAQSSTDYMCVSFLQDQRQRHEFKNINRRHNYFRQPYIKNPSVSCNNFAEAFASKNRELISSTSSTWISERP